MTNVAKLEGELTFTRRHYLKEVFKNLPLDPMTCINVLGEALNESLLYRRQRIDNAHLPSISIYDCMGILL